MLSFESWNTLSDFCLISIPTNGMLNVLFPETCQEVEDERAERPMTQDWKHGKHDKLSRIWTTRKTSMKVRCQIPALIIPFQCQGTSTYSATSARVSGASYTEEHSSQFLPWCFLVSGSQTCLLGDFHTVTVDFLMDYFLFRLLASLSFLVRAT